MSRDSVRVHHTAIAVVLYNGIGFAIGTIGGSAIAIADPYVSIGDDNRVQFRRRLPGPQPEQE